MCNFRAKAHLLALIDDAAKYTGMDRSSFIRVACEEKAIAVRSGPQIRIGQDTVAKDVRPRLEPEEEAPVVKKDECPHPADRVKPILGMNLRVCNACGARF